MLRVVIAFDGIEQPWSHEWKRALASGIRRCGDEARLIPASQVNAAGGDVTVTWGLRGGRRGIMTTSRARGARHLVMERGFLGDRERWTALGFDGIAGRASFAVINDPSRLARLFPDAIKPWGEALDVAIIFGQVMGDATTKHIDLDAWYQKAADQLHALEWGKVYFRPHPIEHRKRRFKLPRGAELAWNDTIEGALARCGLAVTFNSTSAVDAVLHGVRTHAADEGSPAWEVTSHDYALRHPPREEWAARLAWHQWSSEEIATGTAWDALRTIARR